MKTLAIASMLLLSLAGGTAMAGPGGDPGNLIRVAERANGISLDEAAEQVRRQTGGRILSATTISRNGRTVHRIRVLTPDNRVITREIDAGGR